MAAVAVRRALRAVRPPAVPHRGLAKPAGPPSARQLREADEASPIFQYVGKAAKRKDRVFVWGFSYSGALGVPSFVKPDAAWKKPRRIQATPYRLETDEKADTSFADTKGYEYVLEPSPIPLPLEKPQKTRVLQVSCGRAHSLVLTDSEGVFTMGNNSYGQCGRKVVEDEIYSILKGKDNVFVSS
ncbi:hypothetical protein CIB84_007958 [Bambusicola thoracicus]|uniref:Uncharacterized protein n=1 Tax=Bambusicola thoracicus TaxID=9083 RepID=A0A2P4SW20_BAMTH|nr:hypothetical protein CIB84_007958 [Bambusicola thoracicus]